jgi:hypothetical protein
VVGTKRPKADRLSAADESSPPPRKFCDGHYSGHSKLQSSSHFMRARSVVKRGLLSVSQDVVYDLTVDPACCNAGRTIVMFLGHTRTGVVEHCAGQMGSVATVRCRGRGCSSAEQVGRHEARSGSTLA